MSSKTLTRSFAGGEISPLLFGRLDLAKFQTGLQKCLNFLVTPQGPIENRPGFAFVNKADTSGPVALVPFVYNAQQSFALEFGDGYIRFHTLGATLLEAAKSVAGATRAAPGVFNVVAHGFGNLQEVLFAGMAGMPEMTNRWGFVQVIDADHFSLLDFFGNPIDTSSYGIYTGGGTVARAYMIGSPYASADLFNLHFVQSADVLTISCRGYATRELRRLGATNWTLTAPSFSPTIATPAAPTARAGGPGGGSAEQQIYATTAIASGTLEESLQSATASAVNDLSVAGNYNEVQVATVAGAIRYNVYKLQSGIFGYVGQTDGSPFRDTNIVPDMSKTPPLSANPFAEGALTNVAVTVPGAAYGSTSGNITGATVTAGGSGYTAATATISDPSGSGATATVTVAAGAVTAVNITNAGTGYTAPTVTISGDGTGATAKATAAALNPVTLSVTDGGGTGTGAVIQPVIVAGQITGLRVTNAGSGYTAPAINVTNAAGGAGAVFSAGVTGPEIHPQAVSYYEQRRVFGGSTLLPQTINATRSGTESNMTYSIPTQGDDSITARIVAREANVVRHLVPLGDLLALTSGGVWRITSSDGAALTPASFTARPQSYVGASMVQPVVTSASVLYAPDRGAHIRELTYKWEAQSYQADDVSVLAPHLFDYRSVLQLAYSKTPNQILWAVRDDGVLLGLTHQPEHDVKAWHQHTTQGVFESVCAIPEGDEDGVYVVVRRTIGGHTVRYIERMHTRQFDTLAAAFFLDAGVTYSGAPAATVSGLWHLEGASVVALADGGVEPAQTVINGTITLQAPASTVHVGLGYDSDAQTVPLTVETAAAFGQGVVKNVNQVALRVLQSGAGIRVGPAFDKLAEYPQRSVADNYGSAPGMLTGVAQVKLPPSWQDDGSVCIRQSNPLPMTLLSLTIEAATGG